MSTKPVPYSDQFPYPRRRAIRFVMRMGIRLAFSLLSDLRIVGKENLPERGPLIVVANHFHFVDPVAVIRAIPWPIDFLSGFQMPNAPRIVQFLPRMWGTYPVRRGAASRTAMRATAAVLGQGGVMGIFPEGGSWAQVLRPARPGTAYLAAESRAPLLPIGLDGLLELFPWLGKGRRATVTVRIGKPFGPFEVGGRRRERREALVAIGDEIMRRIAELIPPERRGVYSDDPAIRAAAAEAAVFPYDDLMG